MSRRPTKYCPSGLIPTGTLLSPGCSLMMLDPRGGDRMKGRYGSAIGGETVVHRPDRRLGAVVDVDLAQQRLEVDLDGRFRDAEFVRDHLVAGAGHQRLEDF